MVTGTELGTGIRTLETLPNAADLSWFAQEYGEKTTRRFWTWERALQLLDHISAPGVIVETGCMRFPDGWGGDGCSTIILADAARRSGRKLLSFDKNNEAINMAKQAVLGLDFAKEVSWDAVWSDSVEGLDLLKDPIAFLYLDSQDAYVKGAALHQERELIAAWPNLVPGAIVLLDDNVTGGKTDLAKIVLEINKCELVLDSYQSLWVVRHE